MPDRRDFKSEIFLKVKIVYFTMDSTNKKFCKKCNLLLDIRLFYKDNRSLDRHQTYCKKCSYTPSTKIPKKRIYGKRKSHSLGFYGDGLKKCTCCGEIKPAEQCFMKQSHRKDGFHYRCKHCHNTIKRQEYLLKHPGQTYNSRLNKLKKCRKCGKLLLLSCFENNKEYCFLCGIGIKQRSVSSGKEYTIGYYGDNLKKCTKCGTIKELSFFPKRNIKNKISDCYPSCKECKKIRTKKYKENNKEKVSLSSKIYYQKNIEKQKEYNRKYNKEKYKNNRDKIINKTTQWKSQNRDLVNAYNRKYKQNNRLRVSISKAIRDKLKAKGSSKNGRATFKDILTYSIVELRQHLEILFQPGMTWDNYGNRPDCWTVDHIIPDSWFEYTCAEDEGFRKSWALSNLQPMWFCENSSKGNRYSGPYQLNPTLQTDMPS